MRLLTMMLLVAVCAGSVGCSDSSTTLNTAPLTDEQKRQIKEDDARIDDEESKGRGGKLGGKVKAKKS